MDKAGELESATAALRFGGMGATRISTISNRASEAITTDQAVRPISAVLRACWFLTTTWTSKLIRSRSMSSSSRKDSLAISMACWRGVNEIHQPKRFARRQAGRTYVVGLPGGDIHHSRGIGICKDVGGNSRSGA